LAMIHSGEQSAVFIEQAVEPGEKFPHFDDV
jgi:hypothetical protein